MKPYFVLINGLLICAAVYLVGASVYKFAVPPQNAQPSVTASVPEPARPQASPRQPVTYYRPITQRNLFQTGKAEKSATPQIDLDSLKETDLKLKLWGTVTSADGGTWAVIEDAANRKQQLYTVGESIQKATVKMIFRNKVVLNVEGKDEVLTVEDVVSSSTIRRPVAAVQPRVRTRMITLRRSQIERIAQSAGDVASQAQLKPTEGGIALTSIKPRSIFRQLRLINGDVLMEINGEKIAGPADVEKLNQYMQSAPEITLQIMRRGRPRTINYRIR